MSMHQQQQNSCVLQLNDSCAIPLYRVVFDLEQTKTGFYSSGFPSVLNSCANSTVSEIYSLLQRNIVYMLFCAITFTDGSFLHPFCKCDFCFYWSLGFACTEGS